MGIHRRVRMNKVKVVVLTQMGVEVSEDQYCNFLENLERDGCIDVTAVTMNNKGKVSTINIRIFKAEGRD